MYIYMEMYIKERETKWTPLWTHISVSQMSYISHLPCLSCQLALLPSRMTIANLSSPKLSHCAHSPSLQAGDPASTFQGNPCLVYSPQLSPWAQPLPALSSHPPPSLDHEHWSSFSFPDTACSPCKGPLQVALSLLFGTPGGTLSKVSLTRPADLSSNITPPHGTGPELWKQVHFLCHMFSWHPLPFIPLIISSNSHHDKMFKL